MTTRTALSLSILALTACSAEVEQADIDAALSLEGDVASGEQLYVEHCERCHDADGMGRGMDFSVLVPNTSDESLIEDILSGPGFMPNYISTFDSQQVADVVAFMRAEWPE